MTTKRRDCRRCLCQHRRGPPNHALDAQRGGRPPRSADIYRGFPRGPGQHAGMRWLQRHHVPGAGLLDRDRLCHLPEQPAGLGERCLPERSRRCGAAHGGSPRRKLCYVDDNGGDACYILRMSRRIRHSQVAFTAGGGGSRLYLSTNGVYMSLELIIKYLNIFTILS